MSAGATRRPVSSASSRAAAWASRSPGRTWPPTVNHHFGAAPSRNAGFAGSDPHSNNTAPLSSNSTTRAEVRRPDAP
ncbi:Uncharacterised protein [Mycobacterium tuberculosis]|nr:Uncharacterised protein [Mycobacterium tuberculosis]CNM54196.1 Uncharacterised protein [Mycobacterium tuberculosis]CNM79957.1 Uncharacterised protein [Mycobacterium tuberculosis]CNM91534.1 Uncharacterised protein [Mycobacterium tuberculosis]CNM95775.1 Uncharacterised protein [Mycobacterium tuberculosis]